MTQSEFLKRLIEIQRRQEADGNWAVSEAELNQLTTRCINSGCSELLEDPDFKEFKSFVCKKSCLGYRETGPYALQFKLGTREDSIKDEGSIYYDRKEEKMFISGLELGHGGGI